MYLQTSTISFISSVSTHVQSPTILIIKKLQHCLCLCLMHPYHSDTTNILVLIHFIHMKNTQSSIILKNIYLFWRKRFMQEANQVSYLISTSSLLCHIHELNSMTQIKDRGSMAASDCINVAGSSQRCRQLEIIILLPILTSMWNMMKKQVICQAPWYPLICDCFQMETNL